MIWWKELIGYTGMAFLVLSLMFKDTKKLRIFNLTGSLFCIAYGFVTKTYATAILNIACSLINIFRIVKDRKEFERK